MNDALLPIHYYYELPWKSSSEIPQFTELYIITQFFFQLISSRLIFRIPTALRPAFNKPLKVEFKTEKYDKTEFEL